MRRIIVNTSLIAILLILALANSGNVMAKSCTVPSSYPDVATAVLNGCTSIVFDSDVTESLSFTASFPISINGNGFKWILVNPSVNKIVFESDGLVRLYNLNIEVIDQYSAVFTLRNSSLYISNVNVSVYSPYTYIFRSEAVNTYNLSFTIQNFNFYEYAGLGFRRIFNIESASGYQVSVNAQNIIVNGMISSALAIPAAFFISSSDGGVFSLSEAKLNNASIMVWARPGSPEPFNVELSDIFMEVGGVPPYIVGWYVSYIQFFMGSEMDINLYNVSVISKGGYDAIIYLLAYLTGGLSTMYGELIYVENPGRGGVFVSHGGFFNSYVHLKNVTINGLFTLYTDSWRAVEISNSTIVIDGFSFSTYSWLNTFYINEDVTLRVTLKNGVLYNGVILVQDFFQLNSTVYLKISNVTVYSGFFGPLRLMAYFPGTRYYVDINSLYMFSTSPTPSYWSLYLYQSFSSNEIKLDIEYSVLGGFFIIAYSKFWGRLYETVYSEAISFTTRPINVSWTLEIYVNSTRTGKPIAGVNVAYYNRMSLLWMASTGRDGVVLYKYSYTYKPYSFGYRFIDNIRFSINESYFSDAWWYTSSDDMDEFKHPHLIPWGFTLSSYTLPSWFGRIVLSIDPVLEISGIGYIEHRPMTILIRGDEGFIGLYKQKEDVIYPYLNLSSYQPPLKILPLKVVKFNDYGVYMIIETRIFFDGVWLNETFIYYKKSGILYSTGPLEIVAKVHRF